MTGERVRKVRTTMQPWREIEVSDAEYLDLSRQGLLIEDPPEIRVLGTARENEQ